MNSRSFVHIANFYTTHHQNIPLQFYGVGMSKQKINNLYQSLQLSGQLRPNKIAISFEGHNYSYLKFKQQVDVSIHCLQHHFQVKKGDILVLALGNCPEFCSLFYAAMALGAIVVPLSIKLKAEDSTSLLNNVNAKIVFYDPSSQPWLSEKQPSAQHQTSLPDWQFILRNADDRTNVQPIELPDVNHEDIAAIIYTSGTTGKAKGAVISHGNFLSAIQTYVDVLGLTEQDSTVLPIPICHITGLSALLCLFIHIGGTIYLQKRFHAADILDTVAKQQITFIHGSPTVFILLIQEARRHNNDSYPSLRMIACGAGHLNIGIMQQLSEIFLHAEIRPVYGLTETTSPATIFPEDVRRSNKQGSSGVAVPGLQLKVCDDYGNQLPHGQPGHLWLKGTMVINHYWQNPDINRQAFSDGWLYTGDIACIDEQGYLFIKDRSKDMINRGGEKIYSIEIENIFSTYPGVEDVAIVPMSSEIYGEEAIAFIVANQQQPLISDNIIQWLTGKIAKFKIPTKIIFMNKLPKNNNGKTNKNLLREQV